MQTKLFCTNNSGYLILIYLLDNISKVKTANYCNQTLGIIIFSVSKLSIVTIGKSSDIPTDMIRYLIMGANITVTFLYQVELAQIFYYKQQI